MTIQKKFLHCTMLGMLFTCYAQSANATSIVNLDKLPQKLTLEIAGSQQVVYLMPTERWESLAYPIKVKRADGSVSPALVIDGKYALWSSGLALHSKSRSVRKRY